MCLSSTLFYAQSTEEINSLNIFNDRILKTLPSIAGTDYFVYFSQVGNVLFSVVAKSNTDYIFYELVNKSDQYTLEVKQTKIIDNKHKPALDNIFTNLKPLPNVKRYISEYGFGLSSYTAHSTYSLSLFKSGIKTYEFWLPTHNPLNVIIESPLNEELNFITKYCGFHPDQL